VFGGLARSKKPQKAQKTQNKKECERRISEPAVTRKITGDHIESCCFWFGFGSVLSVYSVVNAQKLTTEHTENTEQETEHE